MHQVFSALTCSVYYQVQDNTEASSCGLRRGDELLEANGVDFSSMFQKTATFVLQQSRLLILHVKYNPTGKLVMEEGELNRTPCLSLPPSVCLSPQSLSLSLSSVNFFFLSLRTSSFFHFYQTHIISSGLRELCRIPILGPRAVRARRALATTPSSLASPMR